MKPIIPPSITANHWKFQLFSRHPESIEVIDVDYVAYITIDFPKKLWSGCLAFFIPAINLKLFSLFCIPYCNMSSVKPSNIINPKIS